MQIQNLTLPTLPPYTAYPAVWAKQYPRGGDTVAVKLLLNIVVSHRDRNS
jgi:hypothetical protein